jgi:tRNA(Ile)-lysidine synthase
MRRLRSPTAHAPSEATPPASDQAAKRQAEKLERRFADAMNALDIGAPTRIALALSGGGDSISLMKLLGNWAKARSSSRANSTLDALIVDHGLRAGSAREEKNVAAWARDAGWRAHILKWSGPKPISNIEDAARKARYALLGKWCRAHKRSFLFVAHTRDDVAETFLLRLGRGSGVDGLSAMRSVAPYPLEGFGELEIVRPLLDFGREELRAYLVKEGDAWLDDPMNEDPRFSRTHARALMPALEAAGISQKRIVDASRHLARARKALEAWSTGKCSSRRREKLA